MEVGKTALLKKAISFPVNNFTDFRLKMLNWVNRFNIFCFLDDREYQSADPSFQCLVAAGSKKNIERQAGQAFEGLQAFHDEHPNAWMFGHFGYDLKNETENLQSVHEDRVGFSDLHFFIPEIILQLDKTSIQIFSAGNENEIYESILSCSRFIEKSANTCVQVQQRFSKKDYLKTIEQIRGHILRGDCYELNFCQEFFAEEAVIDPLYTFHRLSDISPNPFSAFYKLGERYCLCASPERYLKKSGDQLISQPIKGTAKRDLVDPAHDEQLKQNLLQSIKERSENVMIVDLVRNDLSKICTPGTVKVDELFGLYSFPQVHQMISTVSGKLPIDTHWLECIKATFPMGSMTGAPKKRVMELIEEYERTKRGLFSGAIGYLKPSSMENAGIDFDFNVVIRSLFYNAHSKYLSYQTGGGITFNSDAEREYEESMLKGEAIKSILT